MACTFCKDTGENYHPVPRYGTGSKADLMIINGVPPQDPMRSLHGAFMIHYKNPADGWVEKIVRDLILEEFNGRPIWATNAVKCPTYNDADPMRLGMQNRCANKWLKWEIDEINPTIIITFGEVARDALTMAIKANRTMGDRFERFYVGTSIEHVIDMFYIDDRTIISAPFPEEKILDRWNTVIRHAIWSTK